MEAFQAEGLAFSTRAILSSRDISKWHWRSMVPPINVATSFRREGPEHRIYGNKMCRSPTRRILERSLLLLENGKHATVYCTGQTAIFSVLCLLESGQHIVADKEFYHGRNFYFGSLVDMMEVDVTYLDITDVNNFKSAIQSNTKMIWIKSPNDMFTIADLTAIGDIAHERDIIFVVDSSWMSPCYQKPLELGADLVIYSASGYLSGTTDVNLGAVVTKKRDLHKRIRSIEENIKAIPSPMDFYLASRGLKTLELRMERHMKSGLKIASFLESHPLIECVLHPGLPSHPQYKLSTKQSSGHSGMFAFRIKDAGKRDILMFLNALSIISCSDEWGVSYTVVHSPALSSWTSMDEDLDPVHGIPINLIRISVGLETLEDLIQDLDNALNSLQK